VLQTIAVLRRRWSWQPPQAQPRSHWLPLARLHLRVRLQLPVQVQVQVQVRVQL
jgi:hypothetical protein